MTLLHFLRPFFACPRERPLVLPLAGAIIRDHFRQSSLRRVYRILSKNKRFVVAREENCREETRSRLSFIRVIASLSLGDSSFSVTSATPGHSEPLLLLLSLQNRASKLDILLSRESIVRQTRESGSDVASARAPVYTYLFNGKRALFKEEGLALISG